MARTRPPVWTALPSRFAGATKPRAVVAIGVLLLLMLGGLVALWRGVAVVPDALFAQAAIRRGLIEGVRAGGDYYSVAESVFRVDPAAVRAWGDVPLPALATLLGALSPLMAFVLQAILVLAVFATWFMRLRGVFARIAALAAVGVLLAGGLVVAIDPLLGALNSLWAGMLVALSLGVWRSGRWIEAAAIALIACTFDGMATLYVALMAAFALVEGTDARALDGRPCSVSWSRCSSPMAARLPTWRVRRNRLRWRRTGAAMRCSCKVSRKPPCCNCCRCRFPPF